MLFTSIPHQAVLAIWWCVLAAALTRLPLELKRKQSGAAAWSRHLVANRQMASGLGWHQQPMATLKAMGAPCPDALEVRPGTWICQTKAQRQCSLDHASGPYKRHTGPGRHCRHVMCIMCRQMVHEAHLVDEGHADGIHGFDGIGEAAELAVEGLQHVHLRLLLFSEFAGRPLHGHQRSQVQAPPGLCQLAHRWPACR